MSDLPAKPSFAEQIKKKKGRVILLGVIALGSMYMWSGILFGKKKAARPQAPPGNGAPADPSAGLSNGSGAPSGPATAGVTPLLGNVNTFDAAMKRIDVWSEPLSLHLDRETAEIEITAWELAEDEEVFDEDIADEVTDLSLTGTAIFGPSKYALIEGKRLQEGQKIGRYVVKEIRAREVVLLDNDKTHILRMAQPKLRNTPKPKTKLGGN